MERELALGKMSKNDIFIDNIFYGRDVFFTFHCGQWLLKAEIQKHNISFSSKLPLTIGHYPCALYLETLPPLTFFSQSFEGINLESIPEALRLLVFQTATEVILKDFTKKIGTNISIETIEFITTPESINGIHFIITENQNHITAGVLDAPKEVIALLAKKIKSTSRLHNFRSIKTPYHIRIGSTQISRDDYCNLCEEDIIFLDQHGLAKNRKIDIVGFDGICIRGNAVPSGVMVQRIG